MPSRKLTPAATAALVQILVNGVAPGVNDAGNRNLVADFLTHEPFLR